jgi:NADPH:quinone reductase-like Zn-dependent oxidoreductase
MKAARVHRFGPPNVIQIEDIEKPRPGPAEVLVAVYAAGVGPWDSWIRSGTSVLNQPLPFTLGGDFSGVVEAVGPDVTEWKPGDEVFGITSPIHIGASAEYAAVGTNLIAHKPRNLTHAEAASVPVIAVTALQILFDHARVTAGERVLVLGAAGSVGAYVVQLARGAGVHLIGTVRGNDAAAYARRLGADEVVDVATARLEDVVAPVQVVLDLVGGEAANQSLGVLERGGRLVTAVPNPDEKRAAEHGVTAKFMFVEVRTGPLRRIATLFEGGRLETNVGTVLPLGDIRAAHEMLDGKRPHRSGKIVLAVRSDAARSVVAAE